MPFIKICICSLAPFFQMDRKAFTMSNDSHKNPQAPPNEKGETTGNAETLKNPFKEPDATEEAETPEEEAAAEQQRKEALTERD